MQPLTAESVESFDTVSHAMLNNLRAQPWAKDATTWIDEGKLTISVDAAHEDVGELNIYAEPIEVLVCIGREFELRFPTYVHETGDDDDGFDDVASEEAAAGTAREALELVTELLADKRVITVTRRGGSVVDMDVLEPGDHGADPPPAVAQAGFTTKRYRWSGPI